MGARINPGTPLPRCLVRTLFDIGRFDVVSGVFYYSTAGGKFLICAELVLPSPWGV